MLTLTELRKANHLSSAFFYGSTTLICLLIFLIPSNLFLKCCQEFGYVNGLFVDYLIPKLYLTNLVAILLLVFWAVGNRQRISQKLTVLWRNRRSPMKTGCWLIMASLGLWIALGLRQLFAPNQVAALWWYGQATLVMTTGLVLIDIIRQIDRSKFSHRFWRLITLILTTTIILQSSLAIFQSTQQKSLAGYWLLGEPSLSQPLGLAKIVTTTGEVRILPYGTTAHPNVLAGTISLYLILMYLLQVRRNSVSNRGWLLIWPTCLLLGGATIWMTQSISGMLTLAIGLAIIFVTFRRHTGFNSESQSSRFSSMLLVITFLLFTLILMPLFIHLLAQQLPENLSLVRRDRLQSIAFLATIHQPLLGLGLNNFTVQMEQYGQNSESVRFVQPVHHVGWLWISETGILGVLFVIALLATILNRTNQPSRLLKTIAFCLLTLTPILVLDHYLLSLPSGMVLYITIISLCTILILYDT